MQFSDQCYLGYKLSPHKHTHAILRGIHGSCNVSGPPQICFCFFLLLTSVFGSSHGQLLASGGLCHHFQTVSLNTCYHECCLSTLNTVRVYKSVTPLFQVTGGTSLLSCYAYILWRDTFITELKQLATPGFSSFATWKAAKSNAMMAWKLCEKKWSSAHPCVFSGEDMMYLQTCGNTGSTLMYYFLSTPHCLTSLITITHVDIFDMKDETTSGQPSLSTHFTSHTGESQGLVSELVD